MDPILDTIEGILYIHGEVFWLKECITAFESALIFLFFRWVISWNSRQAVLLFLSTIIGIACIFLGDTGYWSDNDVLKFIAPISLFLLVNNKNRQNNALLFIFLVPYFFTSYEFCRSFFEVIGSIVSHALIIFCITLVKKYRYLSLGISATIGVLINLIGNNSPPGTNDIFMNPAIITLAVKGIEYHTKNTKYTDFLKSFWATLVCFAFFGSWIFHYIKPFCPLYFHHQK